MADMSTSHSVWKGQIRFGLVVVPVDLHAARDNTARPGFRQIHEPSGQPVNYEKVVPGIGPVDESEILKGHETGKGEYVLLTDRDIDSIQLKSRNAVELSRFVDPAEINPLFYDKAYYVRPSYEAAEVAYNLLRDALASSGKVGIGQISMRGREYLAAVRAYECGIILQTLYYRDEIRDARSYFDGQDIGDTPANLLELAIKLIEKEAGHFDPDSFADHYGIALGKLVAEKLASGDTKVRIGLPSSEVVTGKADLIDVLRESVKATGVPDEDEV